MSQKSARIWEHLFRFAAWLRLFVKFPQVWNDEGKGRHFSSEEKGNRNESKIRAIVFLVQTSP